MNSSLAFIATPLLPHHSTLRCRTNSVTRQLIPQCVSTPPSSSLQGGQPSLQLLSTIRSFGKERTGQDSVIVDEIADLEGIESVPDCTTDQRILGCWRNAHTSKNPNASPIQRAFLSASSAAPQIEQYIFGPQLSMTSLPATDLVTRIDMRSSLGAVLNVHALITSVDGCMLHVTVKQGWFSFERLPQWFGGARLSRPLRVPYFVPFRMLGKKANGWQKITYLDDHVRITRGNLGSCFVLTKIPEQDRIPFFDDMRQICR